LDILATLQLGTTNSNGFTLQQGLLLCKGGIWIVKGSPLQHQILEYVDSNPAVGHSGYQKTLHHAMDKFLWKGMKIDIKSFVRECQVCQENKHKTVLLQPLPIPSRVWTDTSPDFIEGLPMAHGFSVILVIVDRLTKYGHFPFGSSLLSLSSGSILYG
jgi:hypothetical protein